MLHFLTENPETSLSIIQSFWILVRSTEGISTIVVVLVMILKLYINNQATALNKKTLAVSIPSEITVLVVGFLISAAIADDANKDSSTIIAFIIISLIILILQYSSERFLEGKLSGTWNWRTWTRVVLMYVVSCVWYMVVVFGGVA